MTGEVTTNANKKVTTVSSLAVFAPILISRSLPCEQNKVKSNEHLDKMLTTIYNF